MCLANSWVCPDCVVETTASEHKHLHTLSFLYNSIILIYLMFLVIFEYKGTSSWCLQITYLEILVGACFYSSLCLYCIILKGNIANVYIFHSEIRRFCCQCLNSTLKLLLQPVDLFDECLPFICIQHSF